MTPSFFLSLLLLSASSAFVSAVNLTIKISHDNSPEQTSWNFSNRDNGITLFTQNQGDWTSANPSVRTVTILNLTPGNYRFHMKDANGICCTNGIGYITFVDPDGGTLGETVLYSIRGEFTNSLIIDVVIHAHGSFSFTQVPQSSTWPGFRSNASSHSFTVNVKLDAQPQTVSILLLIRDDTYFNRGWFEVHSYQATAADANTLWTRTFEPAEAAVYYLRIRGAFTNNGWATITNSTHVMWNAPTLLPPAGSTTNYVDTGFLVKGYYGYTELFDIPPSAQATLPP